MIIFALTMFQDECGKQVVFCENGGYQDPSNLAGGSCTRCICPSGFGGNLCENAADGTSKLYQFMTTDPNTIEEYQERMYQLT